MKTTGIALALAAALVTAAPAGAFVKDGCGDGACSDCHSLSKDEAKTLLSDLVHDVLAVEPSRVPGLWVVDVETRQKQRMPVYVDFSKQFVISGNVLELATRENVTRTRAIELNRIDPSQIPLDDTVVVGSPDAPSKVVVFTDPDCPFCRKLHPVLSQVAERRPDVAFYVKMYPIKRSSRDKAAAVVCTRSAEVLDAVMAGQAPAPEAVCETDQLDKNLALGRKIGVRSTPTLVLPDGRVVPGYKSADKLLDLLSPAGKKATAENKTP